MHVGIISKHSDPARGGAERYLAALIERLREGGHEVTFLARSGPAAQEGSGRHLARLRDAGAEVVLAAAPVPGCNFYQPHHGILAAAMPPRLEPLPWGLRVLKRVNPYRNVVLAVMRRLEARTLAPPARLLAVSPKVRADAERLYPGVRTILARPGVDLERFRPGEPPGNGPPLLLFVSQNYKLKGLATAIESLRHLPEARLLVVGRERPIPAERVEYLGYVDDLPALYRRAHVLVHPTFYDSASRVVLEALASGRPAITTLRDGNADLAVEGGGAALERPGDPVALAKAVESVLASPDPGRARAVAERLPAKRMLDEVVEILTCGF